MKINLKKFLLSFFVLFIQIVTAQSVSISGKITDKTGMPVPGANVVLKNTNVSTQTNLDGMFTINAKEEQTLIISYLGMKSVEIKASKFMTITLEDASNELEAVMVTVHKSKRTQQIILPASQQKTFNIHLYQTFKMLW